jgi:RIO-like serine/threonine protein kinase
MFEQLRRPDLPQRKVRLLRRSSSTRPSIYIIEENGCRAVVKDYGENSFFFRNLIGRFLVWREEKAYRRLRRMAGVPALYRVMDGLVLLLEEIPGKSLEDVEDSETLPQTFFEEMGLMVEAFHRRGLCHCDLKRASNVLIGPGGKPYVVDWSSALQERELRFFPLNLVYRRFLLDDYNAVTKFQVRHCPETIDPESKRRYLHRSRAERTIRSLRDRLRELLQRVA